MHSNTHTLTSQALISLCAEERNHTMDFLRKGGNISIGIFLAKKIHENSKLNVTTGQVVTESETKNEAKKSKNGGSTGTDSLLSLAVRVIAAAASHEAYVTASISFAKNENENMTKTSTSTSNDGMKEFETTKINTDVSSSGSSEKNVPGNVPGNVPLSLLTPDGKFQFGFLCSLLGSSDNNTQQAALSLIMRILKALPLSTTAFVLLSDDSSTEEKCKVLLELLSPENEKENEKKKEAMKKTPLIPFLPEHSARMFLKGLLCALNTKNIPNDILQNIPKDKDKENVPELYTAALDAISAFVSQSADYYGKIIPESTDVRLESLEYRKARQQKARMLISRSKSHAGWAIEEGVCSLCL